MTDASGSDELRIYDLLQKNLKMHPDDEAVIDGDVRLTYRELQQRVNQYARALLATGVRRGDRVATLAPPCGLFFISYLAAVSIGAVWHGLNPRYKSRDYQYLLEDAQPKVVFTFSPYDERHYDEELQDLTDKVETFVTLGQPRGSALALENFLDHGEGITDLQLDQARNTVQPEDVAVIVYTSGTTGNPKGAMLSQRAIAKSAQINARWMGEGLRKVICPAPINHVGCLNNICMNVFAWGGTIIFYHRVDPIALYQLNQQERPPYMVTSPTGFNMLLDSPAFELSLIDFVELIVYGGATTAQSTLEQFVPLGAKMSSVYGQTETCGIVTATAFDASLEVKAETIGVALEEVELKVINSSGVEVGVGEPGELLVRAPFVMSGYYNRPEATAEALTEDGFLHTGDICKLRADGNYEFVGRIKEMFKSGGYNVYPVEVEQAICEHADVAQAAVLSMADKKFQEVGFAFVVPKAGANLDAPALKAFLNERIANFKIPKQFEFLTEMPLLPNSKIDKQRLREDLNERIESGQLG
ncbi:acyl--CoA ligase [Pseudomaricurvus alkylphenolicus]|uniref:class I adenylate-forming enzyme family protein n=1 Tax=Pseudomaricurvus alkylphenolicus TaxID=1306991 RepID=UPI0014222433|nr:class I adenylate-forming enzyme family protein [Pseudomaricurvus alkylphenolicus]NIB38031.1 acyl--CoA ligase [Pseudomaricurvus alkylphenolicus]